MKRFFAVLMLNCALVATGCSEKPVNADRLVVNSCLGKEHIINNTNYQFVADLTSCSVDSQGVFKGTVACLQEKYPELGAACTDCFGYLAQCGRANCTMKCMFDSSSAKCINCGTENCRCEVGPDGKRNGFSLTQCTGIAIENHPIKASANTSDLVLTCPQ